jgi:tetratricopeptide (TPR) repeat protein
MPFSTKEVQAAPPLSVNFDDVYNLLIKPALEKAGCMPFRADEEESAGDIRTDMYFELVTADAVVADISILNPNVYYELGVRHGVAPRGFFMIYGDWSKPPFDIATDRRFRYDGTLFTSKKEGGDEAWKRELDAEADRLGAVLKRAMEVDEQTIGSPVYKEVTGLKPVDWTNIQTARSKYFGEIFTNLKELVAIARDEDRPGDILTLAEDAPSRFYRAKLLWEAASALINMERYDAAKSVLDELCSLDPDNLNAQTQLGLVLGRLKKMAEAKAHMTRVADRYRGDAEVQGVLGRVFKDIWRQEWRDLPTLQERQLQAVATSNIAVCAIQSYDNATRVCGDYYNGINVVSLVKLLEHLKEATGDQPSDSEIKDLDDVIAVVRFGAQNTLSRERTVEARGEGVWAEATLGELELVAGNTDKARIFYRDAATRPDTSPFSVASMLDQVDLLESLGFRPDAVTAVRQVLEPRARTRKLRPPFNRVFVCSGHMIDEPGREQERFPPNKEGVVKEKIVDQLTKWNVGAGDLAICGGARGADILFAENCAERGAEVWLFLALEEAEFLKRSVRLDGSNWQDRFYNLRDAANVKTYFQSERLKSPPRGVSPYARTNLWIINTARVEANRPRNLYALLVWDEKPTGDGPGGTSDFADRINRFGGRLAPIINPTKL